MSPKDCSCSGTPAAARRVRRRRPGHTAQPAQAKVGARRISGPRSSADRDCGTTKHDVPAQPIFTRPSLEPYLTKALGDRGGTAQLQQLLRNYPAVAPGPRPAVAKLKAGLGRTAFQMAQGSRSARAGEPELERFGDIAGCTDAWSVFRSGKIEFELPKYAVFDDANGQAFNYMMSPYSSAATRAGWLGWAAVGGRIWDANYDALDDGAYYPGWQDRGGRTRWFLRHCIQMAFAYRAFVPPEWPPPVSLFSGQGFSCCSGADQTLFKVLAGDVVDEKYGRKAFIKVEQNTSQCPADGDQLIINVRPAKIGAASVLSQLPLLSTSGQPSLRVRCERVYSFTTTSAGQSEAGFRGRSYWRSDDGWIKFCSSFLV